MPPRKVHRVVRRFSNARYDIQEVKIFQMMSVELLSMIASKLSPASVAAFAISCRFMMRVLGTTAWEQLQQSPVEKLDFLTRLESSLPNHVLCYSCAVFHRRPKHPWMLQLKEKVPSKLHYRDCSGISGAHCTVNQAKGRLLRKDDLNWWSIHLAMRAHRLSSGYGTSLHSLFKTRVGRYWSSFTEALIVDNRLLIKVQSFMKIKTLTCQGGATALLRTKIPACRHLYGSERFALVCFKSLRSHASDMMSTKSSSILSAVRLYSQRFVKCHYTEIYRSCLYRCPWCPSEYRIEMNPALTHPSRTAELAIKARDHEFGSLLLISRWVDAGNGLSSFSPEWRNLTLEARPPQHRDEGTLHPDYLPTAECRFERFSDPSVLVEGRNITQAV